MLIINIDIEKNKENYQAVIKALEAFDIASAEWDTGTKVTQTFKSGHTDPNDLGAAVSAATEYLRNRNRDR